MSRPRSVSLSGAARRQEHKAANEMGTNKKLFNFISNKLSVFLFSENEAQRAGTLPPLLRWSFLIGSHSVNGQNDERMKKTRRGASWQYHRSAAFTPLHPAKCGSNSVDGEIRKLAHESGVNAALRNLVVPARCARRSGCAANRKHAQAGCLFRILRIEN
jgi:hypothetical protein